ncbi:MAG: T9SS type A sorting domain-containing protein [Bacteroidota bacterium]
MERNNRSTLLKLCVLFCWASLFGNFARAEIRVIGESPSTNPWDCNGFIELQIIADEGFELAEPFSINYFQISTIGPIIKSEVTDDYQGIAPIKIEGLCNARYDFIITNAYGCESAISVTLGCSNFDPQLKIVEMQPATYKGNALFPIPGREDSRDGKLVIESLSEDAQEFSYEWSNGATGLVLEDITAGIYQVTVTHEGCSKFDYFTVKSCSTSQLVQVQSSPLPRFEQRVVINEMMDFDIKTQSAICPTGGEDFAYLKVLVKEWNETEFKVPDENYDVNWFVNGEFVPPNSFKVHKDECGSDNFFVRVSNGCVNKSEEASLLGCGDFQNPEEAEAFIKEVNNPCLGFFDGGFTVEVPNPNHDLVTITIQHNHEGEGDGINYELSSQTSNGFTTAEATNLDSGPVWVRVNVNDCYFETSFKLEAKDFDLEFVDYDEEQGCQFEKHCDNLYLEDIWKAPDVDATNGYGGWLKGCGVPVFCGSQRVFPDITIKKKTVKLEQYNAMLFEAQRNGLFTDVLPLFDEPCHNVRFCPATFTGVKITDPWYSLGNTSGGTGMSSNGCTVIRCDAATVGDYLACRSDFYDLGIPGFNDPNASQNGCPIVKENFYQVILDYKRGKFDGNQNFFSSRLYEDYLMGDQYLSNNSIYCSYIIYCEDNFEVISTDLFLNPCSPLPFPEQTNLKVKGNSIPPVQNTCQLFKIDGDLEIGVCRKPNGNYRLNYFDVSEINNTPGTVIPRGQCSGEWQRINFYQLYAYYQNGSFQPIDGSVLHQLLTSEEYREDDRRYCATIVYCPDTHLAETNIETVQCFRFSPPYKARDLDLEDFIDKYVYNTGLNLDATCEPFYEESSIGLKASLCYNGESTTVPHSDPFLPPPVWVQYTYENERYDGLMEENEIPLKVVADFLPNESLTNLGISYFDNLTTPHGLIKTDSSYHYYNYSHDNVELKKLRINHTKHSIENIDAGYTLIVETNDTLPEDLIYYGNELYEWQEIVKSDSFVDIKHLSIKSNTITVAGSFSDSLFLEDSLLAISTIGGAFVLRYDTFGFLQSSLIIEQLDSNIIFSDNVDGEILFASGYTNDSIIIDDIPLGLEVSNGVIIGNIKDDNQITINQVLGKNTMAEIIGLAYAKSKNQYTLAVNNAKQLTIAGDTLINESIAQLSFLSFDNQSTDDSLFRIKNLVAANINAQKFDIAYDTDDNLFVGLTFSNQLDLFGASLTSQGLEDIAIFKINRLGNLEWHRTYGTADNENVSNLMLNSPIVYFAGEFDGLETMRTIGNYKFVNLTNARQRAYISYVFDEIPTNTATARNTPTPNPPLSSSINSEVEVFPNPFSHTFTVRFDAWQMGNTQLIITDMMGKEVHTLHHDTQIGTNEVVIEALKDAPGGIYYISVNREAEKRQSSHKIIRIK